ncbi:MAG: stage III sporulation protein AE [Clostridia bacterium]|nr:stage III sporulation protein AE [Clostridia bacterium]
MRKKVVFCLFLWSLFLPLSVNADNNEVTALTTQEIMENQQQSLDLSELEEFIKEIEQDLSLIFPEFSLSQIIEMFKQGNLDFSPQEVLKKIITYFWREVMVNLSLLGKLLVIAMFGAILQTLQSAFTKGTVARLAYFICFLAVITLTMSSFKVAITTGITTINRMVEFMKLLLPILLVLLTTVGGLTTTALLQPFLIVFLSFMSTFTQKIIFPLIFLTAVLCITNNLSTHFKISRLVSFFKQITKVSIGLVLTLFIGVISVEGVVGAVVDGVTLRTAKYMTGAFIPVAGSMFADALDAIIGGSLLLKNALGLVGVLILGAIILFPVIKVLALAVIYRLASALLQPLDDTLLANTLEEMSGCLFLTFAAIASVAIMFFMTITIIVSTANLTVMFR